MTTPKDPASDLAVWVKAMHETLLDLRTLMEGILNTVEDIADAVAGPVAEDEEEGREGVQEGEG